jgi:hypothetical protein
MKTYRSFAVTASLLSSLVCATAMAGWLGPISDEQGGNGKTCPEPGGSGSVAQQAFCGGRYCDDNWIRCGDPTYQGQLIRMGASWTPTSYTSEEYFSSEPDRAVCPPGYAIIGMSATGSYSDNVRAFCVQMYLMEPPPGMWWDPNHELAPFSEEGGYSADVSPNFLSGFRCTGSYCDNMYYRYTTISVP